MPFCCTYADTISYHSLETGYREGLLKKSLLNFTRINTSPALTYVFDTDLQTHKTEKLRAVSLFKQLNSILVSVQHQNLDLDKILKQEHKRLDKDFSPDSMLNPFLSYENNHFFQYA